jgi:hypothetical protein
VNIRKVGTNFCLNAPYHVANGEINVWNCDGNDQDQRFLVGNVRSQPSPITSQYEVVNDSYEVVLNSIRPAVFLRSPEPQFLQSDESGSWGHAWVTLVKKFDIDTVSYQNGSVVGRTRFSSGLLNYTTVSASGYGLPLPEYNNSFHRKLSSWYFPARNGRVQKTSGEVGTLLPGATRFSSDRLISYFPASISKDQYLKYMPKNEGGLGSTAGICDTYALIPDTNPKSCSCGVFATRLFHDSANTSLISGFEFIGTKSYIFNPFNQSWITVPVGINTVTPTGISKEIDRQNGYSDWNR